MSEILPKKRGPSGANRTSSHRVSSIHNLSNRGRVISGRMMSKSKRVVSKGDLFTQGEDANASFVEDAIDFDANKNTILSNFEEWIKLSADNKITSKNSWQFALIDYFHDLNVIKDGEGINFQRASATLDGCVKIYSSRVESVVTETGKLLSGLANKKNDQVDEEEEQEENSNEDEENNQDDSKKKKKPARAAQSILVPFESIKIKKLDQELSIDPLFKKALSEFDEGGAKSLLLNTLNIDNTGRVVFDATTTGNKVEESSPVETVEEDVNVDMGKLKSLLFGGSNDLENLTICPSMGQLKLVLNDIDNAKSVLSDVNNQFLNAEDNANANSTKIEEEAFNFGDYDDNDFNDDGIFDNDNGMDDAQTGGKDKADQSILANILEEKEKEESQEEYDIVPSNKILDQDLMAYFDETIKSNWRGPEHWKVAAYKKSKKITEASKQSRESKPGASAATSTKKPKEVTLIDFLEEDNADFEDDLFETAKNTAISKKSDIKSETKLPDDIQYNSTRLTNLFLKPHNPIMYHSKVRRDKSQTNVLTDENFFAEQYKEQTEQDRMTSFHQAEFDDINHDYDNDDGDVFGGIDFNDALANNGEAGSEPANNAASLITGGRKVRPEYVNFSRIAKRVDIRLLKDNLWKCLKSEDNVEVQEDKTPVKIEQEAPSKKFGEVMSNIGKLYGSEEKRDLSTSFCFICLLHLANEHSLSVTSNDTHDDLAITGF